MLVHPHSAVRGAAIHLHIVCVSHLSYQSFAMLVNILIDMSESRRDFPNPTCLTVGEGRGDLQTVAWPVIFSGLINHRPNDTHDRSLRQYVVTDFIGVH